VKRGRFTTFERVQLREITVSRAATSREPFDRTKIEHSVALACRKRGIAQERSTSWSAASSARSKRWARAKCQPHHRRDGDGRAAQLDSVAYIRFRLGLSRLFRGP
jgi:transcriptional repressor NrdR